METLRSLLDPSNHKKIGSGSSAILYKPSFDISTLNPEIGGVYTFFIPADVFRSYEQMRGYICGTDFYSPDSDVATIATHSGILFAHDGLLCTERDVFQQIHQGGSTVNREFITFSNEYPIVGLLLSILVEYPPGIFISTKRHGVRSLKPKMPYKISMRPVNYHFQSIFETEPCFTNHHPSFVPVPKFVPTFDDHPAFEYDQDLLRCILSLSNIENGFFSCYRMFLEGEKDVYEIGMDEDDQIRLSIVIDQLGMMAFSRPKRYIETAIVKSDLTLSSITPRERTLMIEGDEYGPFRAITLVPLPSKHADV